MNSWCIAHVPIALRTLDSRRDNSQDSRASWPFACLSARRLNHEPSAHLGYGQSHHASISVWVSPSRTNLLGPSDCSTAACNAVTPPGYCRLKIRTIRPYTAFEIPVAFPPVTVARPQVSPPVLLAHRTTASKAAWWRASGWKSAGSSRSSARLASSRPAIPARPASSAPRAAARRPTTGTTGCSPARR